MLLQNGANVNAADKYNDTALTKASGNEFNSCVLQLLCFGAKIDKMSLESDETGLLQPINNTLKSLRAGNGMKTCLMSDEERRFMWNLAFCFTIQHRGAAFKAFRSIRSFITYHGIFMGQGYALGKASIWTRAEEEEKSYHALMNGRPRGY